MPWLEILTGVFGSLLAMLIAWVLRPMVQRFKGYKASFHVDTVFLILLGIAVLPLPTGERERQEEDWLATLLEIESERERFWQLFTMFFGGVHQGVLMRTRDALSIRPPAANAQKTNRQHSIKKESIETWIESNGVKYTIHTVEEVLKTQELLIHTAQEIAKAQLKDD